MYTGYPFRLVLTPLADTADADVTGVPLPDTVAAVVKELAGVMAGVLVLILVEIDVLIELELVVVTELELVLVYVVVVVVMVSVEGQEMTLALVVEA